MSSHIYSGSSNRGPLAGPRPQSFTQPNFNPWHAPRGMARPTRRLQHMRTAVESDLDIEGEHGGRNRSRHSGNGPKHDLCDTLGLVPESITPRKHMNRQLKATGSLLQLRMLLEAEHMAFDSVNTSHALNLVAKMSRALLSQLQRASLLTAEGVARHRAEHVAPCLAVLDTLVKTHIDQFDAWDVSLSLWSYATVDHYDRHLFDLLCSRALQLTSSLKPADCSNILVAFGRWGHYQPELLRSLPQALLDHMYDAKPAEVSQILWGFARLRVSEAPGRAFLQAVCELIATNTHMYPNQELTTIVWSLTKLHYYPGRMFLQQVESVMLRRLRTASAQSTQNPYYQERLPPHDSPQWEHYQASASQQPSQHQQQQQQLPMDGHNSNQWNERPGQATGRRWMQPRPAPEPRALKPQDLSVILWAFGQLRYKAALLLDELPLCLGAWLPQFSTKDLCCLLTGYANARHYHRGVMEALAPMLAQRMHTLNIGELTTTLWAYGIFQHRPTSEPRFLGLLTANLLARMTGGSDGSGSNSVRPQTYALISKSCANLHIHPEALLQHVVEASATRLHEFRPDEMAQLLYGLSHLASRAPSCELPGPGKSNGMAHTQQWTGAAAAAAMPHRSPMHAPAATPAGAARVALPGLLVPPQGPTHAPETDAMVEIQMTLQPDEMQLFHGVVRQCMRLLDEPSHPYGSRKFMHHQVLNSIIFSCLRIGYTPWALIDFAESKGMRLIQPKTSNALSHESVQDQPIPPKALVTAPGRVRSGHFMRPPAVFDKPVRMRPPSDMDTAAGRARRRRGEVMEARQDTTHQQFVGGRLANDFALERRTLFGMEQSEDEEGYSGELPTPPQPRVVIRTGLDENAPFELQPAQGAVHLLDPPIALGSRDEEGGPGMHQTDKEVRLERKSPPILHVEMRAWQETGKG